MGKQRYASFRKTLAAGELWPIAVHGSNFRVLHNSNSTNPEVSINNGPFYEICAGLGIKGLQDFDRLEFRNPAGTSMELWIAVTAGDIDDSRATFAELLEVDDNSDVISTPNPVFVIPMWAFMLDAAAATDEGSGKVGIPLANNYFSAGEQVTFAGTTNYNGTYTLQAGTTSSKLVITETYVAETFDGVDDRVQPVANRYIAENADRKEILITNQNPTYDVWIVEDIDTAPYGVGSGTPPVPDYYKGTPISPGVTIVLKTKARIYLQSEVGAGCIMTQCCCSYTELEKS